MYRKYWDGTNVVCQVQRNFESFGMNRRHRYSPLTVLVAGDVGPRSSARSVPPLRGHRQTSQQFHLLPPMIHVSRCFPVPKPSLLDAPQSAHLFIDGQQPAAELPERVGLSPCGWRRECFPSPSCPPPCESIDRTVRVPQPPALTVIELARQRKPCAPVATPDTRGRGRRRSMKICWSGTQPVPHQ